MKKMLNIFLCVIMLSVSNAIFAQQDAVPIDEAHFPDYGFRKWVSEHFTSKEIPQATVLRIQETGFSSYPVRSIEGIEYFANLEEVHFKNTSYLHVYNLSKNTSIYF